MIFNLIILFPFHFNVNISMGTLANNYTLLYIYGDDNFLGYKREEKNILSNKHYSLSIRKEGKRQLSRCV
jgi:hypothetical protein